MSQLYMTMRSKSLTQVWYIWGENMAVEDPYPTEGWEISYDNEGFEPFLNPYLLEDQSEVKGNVIVISRMQVFQ
ncbi:MAG: hypothetical protein LIP11_08495 [Clostridiales bacterium]|nr:hypothetical protein [Clostridiales bacterium]